MPVTFQVFCHSKRHFHYVASRVVFTKPINQTQHTYIKNFSLLIIIEKKSNSINSKKTPK